MARKTQNSSQTLLSDTAQTVHSRKVPNVPQLRTSNRRKIDSSSARANNTRSIPQENTSNGEEDSTDGQRNTDGGAELNEAEEDDGQPAVKAPSVRPSIEGSEQTGLVGDAVEQKTVPPVAHQNEQNSDISDDDDYSAVNDISDESEDESSVEKIAEKVNIQDRDPPPPSTNASHWYDFEEGIQGILGEGDSFFDDRVQADALDNDSSSSEEIDYHSAWEGIPMTPVEPQTPMSLPSASPRRVHFEAQTPHRPNNHKVGAGYADSGEAMKDSSEPQPRGDEDDNGSASGYETDAGETTDEEEPPVSASELIKAPHLLRCSPLPSFDSGFVGLPSSEKAFKIPSLPASRRRGGPKLGTFKTSASRSYAMVNKTCKVLLIHHATRPSPTSTPRPSRVGSVRSSSAPQTPVMSQATLALPPDLSETEFSDAAASQISTDPILSAGLDFMTSAGFSQSTSHVSQSVLSNVAQSPSVWVPKDSFDVAAVLGGQTNRMQSQLLDDEPYEEMDESAFEDLIVFPEESSSDEDKISIISASSPVADSFAVDATTPSEPAVHKISPSSASSYNGIDLLGGVGVSTWRNNTNQRPQSRQPSKRPAHGLSLSGNALRSSRHISQPSNSNKKRKIGDVHGRKTPAPTSKRRLTAGHR